MPGDLSGVNMKRETIRGPDYRLVCRVIHEAAWLLTLCISIRMHKYSKSICIKGRTQELAGLGINFYDTHDTVLSTEDK